jgi:hypothetical protein
MTLRPVDSSIIGETTSDISPVHGVMTPPMKVTIPLTLGHFIELVAQDGIDAGGNIGHVQSPSATAIVKRMQKLLVMRSIQIGLATSIVA